MSENILIGGLEAGGTKCICAVADAQQSILAQTAIPTAYPDQTVTAVLDFFSAQASALGPISGLGVASFGPVVVDASSPRYGEILSTPKPGWSGLNYFKALASLDVPLAVTSDVTGAALAEYRASQRPLNTLAYVTVGTGIGVGIVQNGRPFMGAGHPEAGHIFVPQDRTVDPYPGLCPYHGACLEGLASGPALLDRWGKTLSELGVDHPGLRLEAQYLSYLMQVLTLTHMPDQIMVGGGVLQTPGLLDMIREETSARLAGYVSHGPASKTGLDPYLSSPRYGQTAGLVGALALAADMVF